MGRPRLLFLTQTLPYPPHGGVQIRTFHTLRLLAQEFDIHALCFYRRVAHATPGDAAHAAAQLQSYAQVEPFAIPQEHNRLRFVRDHLRSLLTRRPYTVASYDSAPFRARLEQLRAARTFDIIHVDSLDLSVYLPLLIDLPIVCAHHNVESALLERRARTEQNPLLRKYLQLQARLLKKEERYWTGRVNLNITVSDEDRAVLQQLAPAARFAVFPNGVDTRYFQPDNAAENGIVFVGGYSWYPNRDALEYFSADILPLIRARQPSVRTSWVGRAPLAVREAYRSQHGIELTGYVSDVRPHVQSAACYVVPLRVGGGTRLKILDAWAMGKTVVSTSIGCEGLDARDGVNILIRDHPADFADAVLTVLQDASLRARLGAQARHTVETIYDWDVMGAAMLRDYHALVEPRTER